MVDFEGLLKFDIPLFLTHSQRKGDRMTVITKYPKQTKKGNKIFFEKKDRELTNLDWAKWGGWFDTDGSFSGRRRRAEIRLRDKQPVELFSKTFEASLVYHEHKTITPEPYRYEYMAQVYYASLSAEKALWFTRNIYPYLLKEEKKDYAASLLGYRPESKNPDDWSPEEVINYSATAMEGDGTIHLWGLKNTSIRASLRSSDAQYLANVQRLIENKSHLRTGFREAKNYQTQEGVVRTQYQLDLNCSYNGDSQVNRSFFQNLLKEGVMTLDRKKQQIHKFIHAME
jgi:hypothetical protein